MVAPPLGAPEGAVVAGFERIDVARSDPLVEIVDGHVAPDRALADHAFAQGLLARAGVAIVIGPGPLVVGPDLARGVPSDPAIRAGRALALQLVAVALARGNGLPADQVLVGGLTPWLADGTPVARAAGEIALRRALLPRHGLVFDEPQPVRAGWRSGRRSSAGSSREPRRTATVRHRPDLRTIRASRVAAAVATDLGTALEPGALVARARPRPGCADAAARALEQMADQGWRAVIGDTPAPGRTPGSSRRGSPSGPTASIRSGGSSAEPAEPASRPPFSPRRPPGSRGWWRSGRGACRATPGRRRRRR